MSSAESTRREPCAITVIGAGQFGSALASQAVRSGCAVTMWDRDAATLEAIARGDSPPRLPGLRLPAGIRVEHDPARALAGAAVVISAVPSQQARAAWAALVRLVPEGAAVVSTAKGFELHSLLRPTEVLSSMLAEAGSRPVVAVSGPSIAPEIVRGLPSAMVCASADSGAADRVRKALSSETLRLYASEDVVGVETAGAAKNVIALAAGMLDGMRMGTNAKATLLARGIAEIARLGLALGAREETFWGVAGIGDLATTCFSEEGRNRSFGERIGSGVPVETARRESVQTVEGIDTCAAISALRARVGVEMPISEAVHAVLFGGMSPREALSGLMRRAARAEQLAGR